MQNARKKEKESEAIVIGLMFDVLHDPKYFYTLGNMTACYTIEGLTECWGQKYPSGRKPEVDQTVLALELLNRLPKPY